MNYKVVSYVAEKATPTAFKGQSDKACSSFGEACERMGGRRQQARVKAQVIKAQIWNEKGEVVGETVNEDFTNFAIAGTSTSKLK